MFAFFWASLVGTYCVELHEKENSSNISSNGDQCYKFGQNQIHCILNQFIISVKKNFTKNYCKIIFKNSYTRCKKSGK